MVGDSSTAWRSATNPPRARPLLGPREVRVFYLFTDGTSDDDRAAAYGLLSGRERARCRQLLFEEDRVSFVLAHALLRAALSRVAARAPGQWRFTAPGRGRPEIAGPRTRPRLRFSLSHTAGLVACAVTREREVGVDVERIGPWAGSAALAERHFSPSERRGLARLPPREAHAHFFSIWTLKEAYLKARGVGLGLPLDVASFHVAPGAPPAVSFAPGHGEDARGWQFALLEPRPGYRLAVGARRETGAGIDFTIVPS
jgi:4'-phosphopantetheinyl transferase